MLSGCAPEPVLNNNYYGKSFAKSRRQKKLEKKVLAVSLKLIGVSSKDIKALLSEKSPSEPAAVPATGGGRIPSHPYMPSFMVKTSDIKIKHLKGYNIKGYKIAVRKTLKSRGGKLFFKVDSVKFKNIFEIVNFSIANLHTYPVKFRLVLFKKTAAGVKPVLFKSNSGGQANSYIAGSTEIKGIMIFIKRRKSAGLCFGVLMFAKSRHVGKIKFVKLIYKFPALAERKPSHGEN